MSAAANRAWRPGRRLEIPSPSVEAGKIPSGRADVLDLAYCRKLGIGATLAADADPGIEEELDELATGLAIEHRARLRGLRHLVQAARAERFHCGSRTWLWMEYSGMNE